jgi:hypothetical protein
MDNLPLVPLPQLEHHPANPMAAYLDLLAASPTLHEDQPLLTVSSIGGPVPDTTCVLTRTLRDMLAE